MENLDRKKLLSVDEAREKLGYKSTTSIHRLIANGKLKAFRFPHRNHGYYVAKTEVTDLQRAHEVKL